MLAFVPPLVGELSAPALIVRVHYRHRGPSVSVEGYTGFGMPLRFSRRSPQHPVRYLRLPIALFAVYQRVGGR